MKINVAVFMGGKSCEHEISCISANQALQALDKDKYEVIPVYISKNNDFYTGEELFNLKNYADLDALCNKLNKVTIYKDNNKVYIKPIKGVFARTKTIDVAFPVVHGTNVEDGTMSGFFELLDIPYTCSNVLGGAVGQDKAVMKEILEYEGVPTVEWFYIYSHEYTDKLPEIKKKAKELGYPLIIKPANLGSTVGIEVVHEESELEAKIKEASKYDFKLVFERMIQDLIEVNISVMGNIMDAKCSVIEQVLKHDELLSFKDKYEGGGKSSKKLKAPPAKGSKGMASTSRKVPADLNKEQQERIEKYALQTFKCLNANGVVRIDFMIDGATGKEYVNEINTIPGSLAFYLWNEVGIDFTKECDALIENALKMYREKQKKTYTFDTNVLKNF